MTWTADERGKLLEHYWTEPSPVVCPTCLQNLQVVFRSEAAGYLLDVRCPGRCESATIGSHEDPLRDKLSFGRFKPATNRRINPATYPPAFFFAASPYALSLRDLRRRRMRHTTHYGGGRNAPIAGWFIAPTDNKFRAWSDDEQQRIFRDHLSGRKPACPISGNGLFVSASPGRGGDCIAAQCGRCLNQAETTVKRE